MSKPKSIVDASVPNMGRMYDYYLGGHHNFEVDRQAAERVKALLPSAPMMARMQRWCLQDIALELTSVRGYDTIIDFASGLPTQDHIHTMAPEGTTVIYSDRDPVVVEYARSILGDTPNVYFFEAEARQPEGLLDSAEVRAVIGDKRNVGIVYWGFAAGMTDEDVSHVARVLYDWSSGESCWVLQAQAADFNLKNPKMMRMVEMYKQMGVVFYVRPKERYEELIRPWRVDEKGFVSLLEWHGFEKSALSKEDMAALGDSGVGYGAYLVK